MDQRFLTPAERMNRVREAMRQRGIANMQQLANEAGMDRKAMVRALEGGIMLGTIQRVAAALDCEVGYLVDRKRRLTW